MQHTSDKNLLILSKNENNSQISFLQSDYKLEPLSSAIDAIEV